MGAERAEIRGIEEQVAITAMRDDVIDVSRYLDPTASPTHHAEGVATEVFGS